MDSFNVFCCGDKSFLLQLEWMTEDTYWVFVPVSSSWVASEQHPWLNLPPDGCFWKYDRNPEFVLLVLPKILDGLVYASLLWQSTVRSWYCQWWFVQNLGWISIYFFTWTVGCQEEMKTMVSFAAWYRGIAACDKSGDGLTLYEWRL